MILKGDCLDILKELEDNSIDSLVTDPPYVINFMGKSWDDFSDERETLKEKREDGSQPKGKPYFENNPRYHFNSMQQFFTPIWKEVSRVMKPGSFGFIMCIPRQDCLSRMMISLEDAGFNINFSSIYWTYATGFPKAMNMGKAIDKRLGKKRELFISKTATQEIDIGGCTAICKICGCQTKTSTGLSCGHPKDSGPSSDQAKQMEGSYAGFQPKPAVEVVIVVMKPLSESSYIDQAMKDGKGVVWFDDCRIPYADEGDEDAVKNDIEREVSFGYSSDNIKYSKSKSVYRPGQKDAFYTVGEKNDNGRFPANLLISNDALNNGFSRFYSLDAWAEKNLPFIIVPKASKKEKNAGVECFGEDFVCEDCENKAEKIKLRFDQPCGNCGGKVVEKKVKGNNHPTVKPIKLMSYLITMGSRPGDTILDPFAGSGTTGCAAMVLNRDFVLIEKESEYISIIKERLKYYRTLPMTL